MKIVSNCHVYTICYARPIIYVRKIKLWALENNAFKIYTHEWLCMSSHLAPTLHNQEISQCVLTELNFSPNKK
jgi:hypothetical protein